MDDNVDTIRIAAEKLAIEIGADFNVYIDDSASGGLMDGGAGVMVTKETQLRLGLWRPYDGEVLASLVPMRKKRVLEEAVLWLQMGVPQKTLVAVFTDSQSLCVALPGKSIGL